MIWYLALGDILHHEGRKMIQIPDEVKDAIIKNHGNGRHDFNMCEICGNLEWLATHKHEGENEINVQSDPSRGCGKCREVAQREPEVARWAINMMSMTRQIASQRMAELSTRVMDLENNLDAMMAHHTEQTNETPDGAENDRAS